MGNSIKYTTGTESNSLSKGNFRIGAGDVGKGPTSSTGFYKATTPPSGGYRIYLYNTNVSGNIAYYTAANNSELISFTNNIAGQSFTSTTQCLTYYSTQTDKICFNKEYEGISTNGLVFNIDAGFAPSYPTSGITWYDVSGYNYNGTLTNGPTYSGGSIVFDGVNDWVSSLTGSGTSFTNNFSISTWINISGYPSSGYGGIVGRFTPNGGYSGYILAIRPNNKFGFEVASGGTTVLCYSNNTISLNTWYNVVAMKENGTNKIYVNSVLQTDTNTQPLSTSAVVPLTIGKYYSDVNDFYWPGKLPVVQIYNRALSATEVLQNYQKMLPRFVGENFVTNGLVFYLDAGYNTSYPTFGTTWYDVSGYNNNGTLTNGPTYSGGSIVFDGTNDYVNVPYTTTLTPSIISFNTWVYSNNWSLRTGNQKIFSKTQIGGYALGCAVFTADSLEFLAYIDGSYKSVTYPLSSLGTGWKNIQGGFDGRYVRLYINGVLVSTYDNTTTSNITYTTNSQLIIAAEPGDGTSIDGNYFNGNIATVQIYNRGLSASEVLQNYNAQKGRFGL